MDLEKFYRQLRDVESTLGKRIAEQEVEICKLQARLDEAESQLLITQGRVKKMWALC